MKADIDKVADSGAEGVVIEIPASRRFIERAYGWTLEKAIALSVEATSYARERGLYTVFSPSMGAAHSLTILCRSSRLLRRMAIWMRLAA